MAQEGKKRYHEFNLTPKALKKINHLGDTEQWKCGRISISLQPHATRNISDLSMQNASRPCYIGDGLKRSPAVNGDRHNQRSSSGVTDGLAEGVRIKFTYWTGQ